MRVPRSADNSHAQERTISRLNKLRLWERAVQYFVSWSRPDLVSVSTRSKGPEPISSGAILAHIDPFGGNQFTHPRRRDAYRAVSRARGRHHLIERFQ